jgi:hypothetical protein
MLVLFVVAIHECLSLPFVIMVFSLENHHFLPIILKFLLCFTNHSGHSSGVHLLLHIHHNH